MIGDFMRLFFAVKFSLVFMLLVAIAPPALAAQKPIKVPVKAQSIKGQSTKVESTKVDGTASEDGYVAASSTHIDFSETTIDGKMKAPEGFMLQGHQSSSLSQMVKLRSNFRNELNNSRSATKALVK